MGRNWMIRLVAPGVFTLGVIAGEPADALTFLECGTCSNIKKEKEGKFSTLTFGVEGRLRYELLDNLNFSFYGEDPPKGVGHDGLVIGRFRAGFDYRPTKNLHFALWGADAEAWDFDSEDLFYKSRTSRYAEDPELYLGFAEFKDILGQNINIKIGRQRLDYGDFRVLGLCDWINVGPYLWDAVLFSKRFENGFVDMFYGRTSYQEEKYFSLNRRHWYEGAGLYSHFQLPKGMPYIAIEPFFISKRDDHESYAGGDLDDFYYGARSYGRDLAKFDYDVTYVKEFGDYGTQDIDAYFLNARVGYNFSMLPVKPRFSIGYTTSSGNDPDSDDYERYGTAFGVWGAAYGQEYNMFSFQNFDDYQASLEIFPHKDVVVELHYHDYKLNEEGDKWRSLANTGALGDDVGDVVEFEAKYNFMENQSVGIQGGVFMPGDYAERRMGFDEDATWFLLEYNIRHSFDIIK